jgi:hypothetical protein
VGQESPVTHEAGSCGALDPLPRVRVKRVHGFTPFQK